MTLDHNCGIVEYVAVDFLGRVCYKMGGVAVVLCDNSKDIPY